jgi:hypothetical protein
MCWLAIGEKGWSDRAPRATFGCFGCKAGFHPECWFAFHHPSMLQATNPTAYASLQLPLKHGATTGTIKQSSQKVSEVAEIANFPFMKYYSEG